MRLLSRSLLAVFTIMGLAAFSSVAKANDVYISQGGGGGGSSCSSTLVYTYFNTAGNWTSGAPTGTQIGPGTTVHLCGTFTAAAGATLLTAQGSGTSSNPITIHFDSGATLTAPYFVEAILVDGKSYITVDGGGTGVASQGTLSGEGVIENTANGSSGTLCPSGSNCQYQVNSIGVSANDCLHCVVKNLSVINLYMHNVVSDEAPSQQQINAVDFSHGASPDYITIQNNLFHDVGWAITCAHGQITVSNNYIFNMDHGFACGAAASETVTGIVVDGNHFGSEVNWDDTNDQNHHDGVHLFDNNNGGVINGSLIYNNLFNGDSGVNGNAYIYQEQGINSTAIFNNVLIMTANRYSNVGVLSWQGEGITSTSNAVYNNTIIGANYSSGGCFDATYTTGFNFKNNVIVGCNQLAGMSNGTTMASGGINNNVYENVYLDQGGYNAWNFGGTYSYILSNWQTSLPAGSGQDMIANAGTLSQINLNSSNGQPQSGSIVYQAAANLSSLCTGGQAPLCSDAAGNPRLSTGNWDAGAYNYGSQNQPAPPTALVAIPH